MIDNIYYYYKKLINMSFKFEKLKRVSHSKLIENMENIIKNEINKNDIKVQYDKLLGMFMGGFLGDALGAPFKIQKTKRSLIEYTGLLQYEIIVPTGRKINTIYPAGSFTDNSMMTYYLMNSIIETNTYSRDNVLINYFEFANNTDMIDINTKKLFKIKTIKTYETRFMKINPHDQSNISLMRASPLSVFSNFIFWVDDAMLSNIHSNNIICSIIYISSLRNAINGKSKEYILDQAEKIAKYYNNKYNDSNAILLAIIQAKSGIRRNVNEKKSNKKTLNPQKTERGWIIHSLYASLWSLLHFNDYKSGIDQVILLGGDTDTNAKISGDLLGAFYGYTHIYNNEINNNNLKILYNANSDFLFDIGSRVSILNNIY